VVALKKDFPIAVFQSLEGVRGLVPMIEITHQIKLFGMGCPFTVIPAAINVMETEIVVRVRKITQCGSVREQSFFCLLIERHTFIDKALIRHQLRVAFQNLIHCSSPDLSTCFAMQASLVYPLLYIILTDIVYPQKIFFEGYSK
jgi:hypothetical protein